MNVHISAYNMEKYQYTKFLFFWQSSPFNIVNKKNRFTSLPPFILHVGKCTTQNSGSLNAALITNQNNTLISPWLNIKHQQHYEEHMSLFSIHYDEGVSTSMGYSLIGHQMVIMWHVLWRGVLEACCWAPGVFSDWRFSWQMIYSCHVIGQTSVATRHKLRG